MGIEFIFLFIFKKNKFVVYRIFLQIDLASSIEGGMRRVKYLNEGITPLNHPSRGETDFYFVSQKIEEFLPQLSYSINESLSEVAVHGGEAGMSGQKHVAIRLSVPKETPYEI